MSKIALPTKDSEKFIIVELYEALYSVVEATNVAEQFWRVPKALKRYEEKYGKNSNRDTK